MPTNANPRKGRILALDLGKKRIGLALSDPLGVTAQGLPTLQRVNIRTDLAELERLAVEYDVQMILLGLPLHMSGDEGRQSGHAREFAQRLTERTGRQVRLWDERLTTVAAERVLKSSGISIAKRAKAVDRLSAQILLESFLEMGASRLKKSITLLLLAGLAAGALYTFHAPFLGFENEKFVVFQKGSGTRAMAQELADAGVIRYGWPFLVVRALHPRTVLQAGEYRFDHAASVSEVFGRLSRGDVYYFNFTVPEGSNMFDIAGLLESEGIMPGQDFLKAAKGMEGFLFPSTYRLSHSTTAAALTQMMTAQFHKEWNKLMPDPAMDVLHTVTLASLIEKETGLPAERPLVAGVFENRLKIGMPLGCDPTVIYAALLENRYHGVIHRSDLDSKHPYNTYQRAGLPPGPIANPGTSSLAAALHPAETEYLYFVAKPGGDGHVFSSNLAAHDKAVGNYRHARNAR